MITYLQGDATDPQGPGSHIIAHVCNDIGAWGRGIVLSLSQRWPEAERSYRRWYQEQGSEDWPEMSLGNTVFVPVEQGRIWVANMVAQHGILKRGSEVPIRYPALEECLLDVARFAHEHHATVHMPRIGCGLAGGKWSEVEPIVERALGEMDVCVYDFASSDARTVAWQR